MIIPAFLGPFFGAVTASLGWVAKVALPGMLGSLFLAVLTRVGLLVVYFIAVNAAVDILIDQASGYLSGLPADVLSVMTLTGLVNAMNIITSAYLFKLTLRIDAVKLLASKA